MSRGGSGIRAMHLASFRQSTDLDGILGACRKAVAAVGTVGFRWSRTHWADFDAFIAIIAAIGFEDPEKGNGLYPFQNPARWAD